MVPKVTTIQTTSGERSLIRCVRAKENVLTTKVKVNQKILHILNFKNSLITKGCVYIVMNFTSPVKLEATAGEADTKAVRS